MTPGAELMNGEAFQRAFAESVPGSWPEGTDFLDAAMPEAIGEALVKSTHRHLRQFKIGYIFKEKMKSGEKIVLGKASKADPKLKFFAGHDFLIVFNWDVWRAMSSEQRTALVDHELCHFGFEELENGQIKTVVLHHDVEEFNAIIQRWGLWKRDVQAFAQACAQFELPLVQAET